jgi:integrase
MELDGEVRDLGHALLHNGFKDISTWFIKTERYLNYETMEYRKNGKDCTPLKAILYPSISFLKIFIGQRGQLTRIGIHTRMKYWVKRLGLPDSLSFHSWRHGAATRWLDSGIPLTSVRDQLGHSSISTTSAYLWFTAEAKEKLKAIS